MPCIAVLPRSSLFLELNFAPVLGHFFFFSEVKNAPFRLRLGPGHRHPPAL